MYLMDDRPQRLDTQICNSTVSTPQKHNTTSRLPFQTIPIILNMKFITFVVTCVFTSTFTSALFIPRTYPSHETSPVHDSNAPGHGPPSNGHAIAHAIGKGVVLTAKFAQAAQGYGGSYESAYRKRNVFLDED
ncbi:hypothetical protein H0H92_015088 [Tricholoma furcatifolium]|nr:hypothetical protein H0H92_015088 [Tricholoma furcatifolium]